MLKAHNNWWWLWNIHRKQKYAQTNKQIFCSFNMKTHNYTRINMKDKCPITISFYDTACSCYFLYDPNLVFANDPLTISSFGYYNHHHHHIWFDMNEENPTYYNDNSVPYLCLKMKVFWWRIAFGVSNKYFISIYILNFYFKLFYLLFISISFV